MQPDLIRLRTTSEIDSAFCYQVKKEAIGPYVAQIWGWDEVFQQEFHAHYFEILQPEIIVFQEGDIGTIVIARHDDHLHLGEFYLLPQFQGQGIGTLLLEQLIQEAQFARLPVRLEVLKINPVQSLYARHGFVTVGQREHHFLMERATS